MRSGRGALRLTGAAALLLASGIALLTGGHHSLIAIARAAPQDEITRRDFAIAGFKPPPRWEVLPRERRSYPQLLAWASRGEGAERAVITLVGKRLPRGATLTTISEEATALRDFPRAQNVRALPQFIVGWPANQRVQLDAQLKPTKTQPAQVMRQLIYMNPPFAYILTLVCPQENAAARYRDLDDTAGNLTPLSVSDAASTSAPAPPAAAPPAAPPSAAPTSPAGSASRTDGGAK